MSQQPTSIESFHKLNHSVTAQQRSKIYNLLKKYPALKFSDRDISKATDLAINIVESRRNDLDKKYHRIVFAGTIYDSQTKRRVNAWRFNQ